MSSPAITHLFFDIGGVMIRDTGLKQKVQDVFAGVAADTLWTEINIALLPACRGQATRASCWSGMARRLGVTLDAAQAEHLWDADDFVDGMTVDDAMLELVRSLRPRYRVGVISNTMDEHAAGLRRLGVYACFDDLVLSHEVQRTKDDPVIFEIALQRLGARAGQSVFIDDFQPYVDVAAGLGFHAIRFTGVDALLPALQALGVAVPERS